MTRAHRSQLREILLQLTDLRNRLDAIQWEIGEDIPIEKGLKINKAVSNLKSAIENLVGAI